DALSRPGNEFVMAIGVDVDNEFDLVAQTHCREKSDGLRPRPPKDSPSADLAPRRSAVHASFANSAATANPLTCDASKLNSSAGAGTMEGAPSIVRASVIKYC